MVGHDPELNRVANWLRKRATVKVVGTALRGAIDSVLDGVHTGRYSIDQLDPTEKTHIGLKVEHYLLHGLGLAKQPPLDTQILGIPVDVKFTLQKTWMIPPEALNQICILVSANDFSSTFDFGIVRAIPSLLNRPNRDKKHSLSMTGRQQAIWLHTSAPLPENLLLHLDRQILAEILGKPRGQQQVTELFRRVHGQLINLTTVDTLGRQRDSSRRVRQARADLEGEGIRVLSVRYDSELLHQLGFGPVIGDNKDGWIAVRA